MSMHKVPLTDLEREGLILHRMPVGSPSQLSDAFRLGIAWCANNHQKKEPVTPLIEKCTTCVHGKLSSFDMPSSSCDDEFGCWQISQRDLLLLAKKAIDSAKVTIKELEERVKSNADDITRATNSAYRSGIVMGKAIAYDEINYKNPVQENPVGEIILGRFDQ